MNEEKKISVFGEVRAFGLYTKRCKNVMYQICIVIWQIWTFNWWKRIKTWTKVRHQKEWVSNWRWGTPTAGTEVPTVRVELAALVSEVSAFDPHRYGSPINYYNILSI